MGAASRTELGAQVESGQAGVDTGAGVPRLVKPGRVGLWQVHSSTGNSRARPKGGPARAEGLHGAEALGLTQGARQDVAGAFEQLLEKARRGCGSQERKFPPPASGRLASAWPGHLLVGRAKLPRFVFAAPKVFLRIV